jgi:hypothetical protein
MKTLALLLFVLFGTVSLYAGTELENALAAAKKGDDVARLFVAYTYYLGVSRDGTKVEKNLNVAYAWASLAGFQGNEDARKLADGIIPKLKDRKVADDLAGSYFKLYGAMPNSARRPESETVPNQSPDPTPTPVTPVAEQPPRQP